MVGCVLNLIAVVLDPAFAYLTLAEPFLGIFAGLGWFSVSSRWQPGNLGAWGRARR